MSDIYNREKLMPDFDLMADKKAMVAGGGAVGVALAEALAKRGVGRIDIVDYDTFTEENAAKHSALVRTPEDVDRKKAPCIAQRLKPYLIEGGQANGLDSNLKELGPEAFADYDVVFVALDNYDAKRLLNEQLKQLPESRRPIAIMAGTHGELAGSACVDMKTRCLRCLMSEDWLQGETLTAKTSCTGPQVLAKDAPTDKSKIVRTGNGASTLAALLAVEQFRDLVIGAENVLNRRWTFTAYPNLELSVTEPMEKKDCPGCAIKPPGKMKWMHGSVLELTLGQALEQIAVALGSDDAELGTALLEYKGIVHGSFIVNDVCQCCGKPIQVMRHEGRLDIDDLVCPDCKQAGKELRGAVAAEQARAETGAGQKVNAFTKQSPAELMHKTLFELGYPLGAHIKVLQRGQAFDFLDADKMTTTVFACDQDHDRMHIVAKL